MIADPFSVLGVSEDVSDADLKKAYRNLSKKWHPDANPDNPKEAEKKFQEITEAYRQIVDARAHGTSPYGRAQSGPSGSSSYGGSGYADYGGMGGFGFEDFFNQWAQYSDARRQQEESNEMTAARNYINAGYYREAMNALGQVPEGARGARWFYYAGVSSQGLGNNVDALNYAKRAADMEPDNADYASFLRRLQNGGSWYQDRGQSYGQNLTSDATTRWCLSICAINLLCNCCCGGRFFYF